MALLPQGSWLQQTSQPGNCTGPHAGSARVNLQDFSGSSYLFSPQLQYFRYENRKYKFGSRRAEAQSICNAESGRLQMGVGLHERMQSLQFNKRSHFTASSEDRTKRSLCDQDYTRLLYSCLCWGRHLFKTTTSNISKARWPHLASWSQPVETHSQLSWHSSKQKSCWDEEREHSSFCPPFPHLILLPVISISIPFLSEPLLLCTDPRADA